MTDATAPGARTDAATTRPPPAVRRVLETSLYVDDLPRARAFYEAVLGLEVMFEDARLAALDGHGGTVVLLFRRGASAEGAEDGRGSIPGHDGRGALHFALAVDSEELDRWRAHLRAVGVVIESERSWARGGTSLYFRDPDRHLVELATPGVWPVY